MPVNKNAQTRYTILDRCFRNTGRRYAIEDLIEECSKGLLKMDPDCKGVSKRQVYLDIAHMETAEGWSIDLERTTENRRVFYRYCDGSFSIYNMPLSEIEIEQLRSALRILRQFKGMPQFEWISDLTYKMDKQLKVNESENQIIDFDANEYLKGIEFIGILYNAIYYKKVLKITYRPFMSEEASTWTIHPYYLKQFNNRWFLFGYCIGSSIKEFNLALDRIESIKEITEKYIESETDWQEYFEDFVGVTKPEGVKPSNIILHFFGKQGHYILTKPLHGTQKTKWIDTDLLEVRLNLVINHEFEIILLGFCGSMKIIEPKSLRNSVLEKLEIALSMHKELK